MTFPLPIEATHPALRHDGPACEASSAPVPAVMPVGMTRSITPQAKKRAPRREFGSISARRNDRYYIRYTDPRGNRVTGGGVSFRTKAEARQRLNEIEAEMNKGTWRDPAVRRGPLLEDYAEEWLPQRTNRRGELLALRTRELNQDLLRLHVIPQLGHRHVAEITREDVRRWHAGRLGKTGPSRVRQAYSLLRAIMRTAVDDGLISSTPCQIVGAGSNSYEERPYLSMSDYVRLRDALPTHLRLPMEVKAFCQLRLGEVLALQRGDVDLLTGVLHVRRAASRPQGGEVIGRTKTRKVRKVVIPPDTLEALRVHLGSTPATRPTDWLFWHPSGRKLSYEQVRSGWKQARLLTGLKQYRPNDLRHAGLTWLAELGMSVRELRERAGHSTDTAAMNYQHRSDDRERQLVATLRLPESLRDAEAAR